MISVKEAIELISKYSPQLSREVTPVSHAIERRLAEDLVAGVSKPPTDVSAMDGYAVRLADVTSPGARLQVVGEAPAGKPYAGTIETGTALRVFTGSAMPRGTDHVVIQENVERHSDAIIVHDAYPSPAHIRKAGSDFQTEETIIQAETILTPYALGIALAINHTHVSVFKKPKVAIIANGNELKPAGSKLNFGDIINSNSSTVCALAEKWGATSQDLGIAKDSVEAIQSKLDIADDDTDVFVVIGGASVGDYDYTKQAFAASGFELIFNKVLVKPGKPTWFAQRGKQLVLGLPGNPASAFVCANLFLRPLLQKHKKLKLLNARTSKTLPRGGQREEFLRASALNDGAELWVTIAEKQDSSRMMPFLKSNCLVRRPAHAEERSTGDIVDILVLGEL